MNSDTTFALSYSLASVTLAPTAFSTKINDSFPCPAAKKGDTIGNYYYSNLDYSTYTFHSPCCSDTSFSGKSPTLCVFSHYSHPVAWSPVDESIAYLHNCSQSADLAGFESSHRRTYASPPISCPAS